VHNGLPQTEEETTQLNLKLTMLTEHLPTIQLDAAQCLPSTKGLAKELAEDMPKHLAASTQSILGLHHPETKALLDRWIGLNALAIKGDDKPAIEAIKTAILENKLDEAVEKAQEKTVSIASCFDLDNPFFAAAELETHLTNAEAFVFKNSNGVDVPVAGVFEPLLGNMKANLEQGLNENEDPKNLELQRKRIADQYRHAVNPLYRIMTPIRVLEESQIETALKNEPNMIMALRQTLSKQPENGTQLVKAFDTYFASNILEACELERNLNNRKQIIDHWKPIAKGKAPLSVEALKSVMTYTTYYPILKEFYELDESAYDPIFNNPEWLLEDFIDMTNQHLFHGAVPERVALKSALKTQKAKEKSTLHQPIPTDFPEFKAFVEQGKKAYEASVKPTILQLSATSKHLGATLFQQTSALREAGFSKVAEVLDQSRSLGFKVGVTTLATASLTTAVWQWGQQTKLKSKAPMPKTLEQ
jgi:hypothetical protein